MITRDARTMMPQNTERQEELTDPYQIAKFIHDAKKTTPVKVYVNGDLTSAAAPGVKKFGHADFWVLFGEYAEIAVFLDRHQGQIKDYVIEHDRRNSAIPLLDLTHLDARIEPGAVIRDRVRIGKHAVIMMGAVINIGCEIGDDTMIDMNAVLGARATVGKAVHVGAGAVLAGVLEPPNATPVVVEDGVMIGANAVILEGVRIGAGAVVAAGAIVTRDVPPDVVVAGAPANIIKRKDEHTREKTQLLKELRG